MNRSNVELLISHSSGLQASYYRPIEQEVLADYLKTVDLLTINHDSDKTILKKQGASLTQKNKDELYIIRAKLAEKRPSPSWLLFIPLFLH